MQEIKSMTPITEEQVISVLIDNFGIDPKADDNEFNIVLLLDKINIKAAQQGKNPKELLSQVISIEIAEAIEKNSLAIDSIKIIKDNAADLLDEVNFLKEEIKKLSEKLAVDDGISTRNEILYKSIYVLQKKIIELIKAAKEGDVVLDEESLGIIQDTLSRHLDQEHMDGLELAEKIRVLLDLVSRKKVSVSLKLERALKQIGKILPHGELNPNYLSKVLAGKRKKKLFF